MSGDAIRSSRQFIAGLAAAPLAGFAHAGLGESRQGASAPAVATGRIPLSEYRSAPDPSHLNTAGVLKAKQP